LKDTNFLIYETNDAIKVEVVLENENIWLTQEQISKLYNKAKSTINEHIKNIYAERELKEKDTMRKFGNVEFSTKPTNFYNLEMIIAIGYRVKSNRGIQFRILANTILKEYLVKGYNINVERFKNNGNDPYFEELLDKIRDIRSSEKVLYRQVLDLYATAIDYNPNAEETIRFFKIVQNKFHFAAHGNTAAEVIYNRADSNKPFMGLTNFKGELPSINDIEIAKNYLTEEELLMLNNLVSGYFDFAEFQAMKHKPMRMKDYINQLDKILDSLDANILLNAGKISHKEAIEKAKLEYGKYQIKELTSIEKEYLKSINKINEIAEKLNNN